MMNRPRSGWNIVTTSQFDQKFGADFLSSVPLEPGVYRFYDKSGKVIYVGKAKRLRRRLGQYRLATKQRKHRRMRKILTAAHALDFSTCASHLDACLLEIRLIQELRPRWNIAGAYSFLYPYVGLKQEEQTLWFAFSTKPQELEGYDLFGAFRSRAVTGEAFFSLIKLLSYVGHRNKVKHSDLRPFSRHTYAFSFHRLPTGWAALWIDFFKGVSREALEVLLLNLLENAGARTRSTELQEKIDALRLFWVEEVAPLAKVIAETSYPSYPVSQSERDLLFLRSRHRE